MKQGPPSYSSTQGASEAQYTTQTTGNVFPQNPGAPMQAVYVTNPGYPPSSTGPAMTTTTTRTVVQQQPPAVMHTPGFGYHDVPVSIQCPICKVQIVTGMEFEPGTLSWVACFGLAAVGCIGGCCLIPFCVDEMKDVTHSCPNCHTVVGVYRRL